MRGILKNEKGKWVVQWLESYDAIKSVIEEDNLTDSFATWFKWTLLVVLSVSLFLIIKYWNYKLL